MTLSGARVLRTNWRLAISSRSPDASPTATAKVSDITPSSSSLCCPSHSPLRASNPSTRVPKPLLILFRDPHMPKINRHRLHSARPTRHTSRFGSSTTAHRHTFTDLPRHFRQILMRNRRSRRSTQDNKVHDQGHEPHHQYARSSTLSSCSKHGNTPSPSPYKRTCPVETHRRGCCPLPQHKPHPWLPASTTYTSPLPSLTATPASSFNCPAPSPSPPNAPANSCPRAASADEAPSTNTTTSTENSENSADTDKTKRLINPIRHFSPPLGVRR